MDSQQEYVLRTLEERDIRIVRLWFTDIIGSLKSVAVAPAELESGFAEGIGFDGSAIEGFSRVSESDTIAMPDPSTFQLLPFNGEDSRFQAARMFCDILTPDGKASCADPRQVLRRQVRAAAEEGFECAVSPELEFFLVEELRVDGQSPVPTDNGGYFDQSSYNIAPQFRRDAMIALEEIGIPVEFSHHETAPGQQEIDLRHADILTMADSIMTFRYLIKLIAQRNGVGATFMPKPFRDHAGSAMHTHMSLFEGDVNAFHDPDDEYSLSQTAKHFIAGILTHAHEISAITNQWTNSYKRLLFGNEAPTAATWGVSNRSAMVRVPTYRLAKEQSRRVEIRTPDSASNPYLAFAVLLGAGLKGIREGYELIEPAEDDIAALSRRERIALGYRDLPGSLDQALRTMERSEFVADILGEHVFEYFLRNKWSEWHDYQRQITSWELKHSLMF
ncbi:glutamine synthetase family protein [Corynebacterium sp. ES2794-CONJ1]|uniref:glutamine synthetase family protein n=1 Tax=unclassified Corynebacterium TaxID=2624378 RepID=UPI00216A851E|nr:MULTISPECIES: glutamine synthetase family protein [unclassified Corynebacterium]MCS4490765.1 glutamine synthetase family protein [Corynebacterium sp. ES2775-CONJ]MCS4492403.1 glutamine synthetase family protein [Corynebacterium sp. ES2715-CONJ3]MCS4532682.1 glutamine synthetase family protein [Corynebacterium sp. ES2730-CONJ]MCU9518716.1 glutamine synthetase family protein [Corynebacterium sp. ES2794-CONJ1]